VCADRVFAQGLVAAQGIRATGKRSKDMLAAAFAIAALYVGSTVLTPLYPIYRDAFGFSQLTVTVIYAVYVVGNLAVLFAFGRLSDQIGRRAASQIALGITLLSAMLFLFAQGAGWLIVARAVNGFAAGLGAGALTAWIAELEPRKDRARASVIASAGNLAGLAVGGILAGLLAQYLPAPLRTVFVVYIVTLIAVALFLSKAPETVKHRVQSLAELDLHPRLGVPSEIRFQFLAPACSAFAAFALGGFFAALIPGLLTQELAFSNVAVIGAIVALFFGVACLSSALTRAVSSWVGMFTGAALVFPGVALLICAETYKSMTLLLVASAVAGAAMALSYRGSLQVVNEIAPSDRRAEVVSTYLLMCYLGNSVPVLGVGLLSSALGAPIAHRIFAAVVAALALTSLLVGTAGRRRMAHKPSPA